VAADIPLAIDNLLSKVDCLSNLTDNTVVGSLPVILEAANARGIPVFGSEIEQVKIGCVAGEGLEYYELGKQTGKMAAKVIKGGSQGIRNPLRNNQRELPVCKSGCHERIGVDLASRSGCQSH